MKALIKIYFSLILSVIILISTHENLFSFDKNNQDNKNATDPNPPVFISPTTCPNVIIFEQTCLPITFTIAAADSESGPVTLTATGLPPSAVMTPPLPVSGNPVTSEFSWVPGNSFSFYNITFIATDSSGNQTTCSYFLDFPLGILNPPNFSATVICGTTLNMGVHDTIEFPVIVFDESYDVFTLTATGIPAGATVTPPLPFTGNKVSLAFKWIPDVNQSGTRSITFKAVDFCGRSDSCKISFDIILPVELSSFTSDVIRNDVTLKWTTSSETNNARFEIERKISGSDYWMRIGTIAGNGNTSVPFSYIFRDRGLSVENYNYRLKQIDFNGNSEYHTLSNEVVIGVPVRFSMSQNYPNPFNPVTKIDFKIPKGGNVELKIYDNNGKKVKDVFNSFRAAGYYTEVINASDFASGVYYYELKYTDGFVSYRKVLKMLVVK